MADKIWIATTAGSLSTGGNWSGGTVPVAGDNVRFPAGTASVTGGLTALSTATLGGSLGYLIFEEGYTGTVGTDAASPTYMDTTPSRFEFAGEGVSFINLQAANIAATVNKTANPDTGKRGLYLKGTGPITTLAINQGHVGVAIVHGEASTVTTTRVSSNSSVWLGAGVTGTTFQSYGGGQHKIRCALTTLTIYNGEVLTEEVGAITTVNLYAGKLIPGSTGTITTLNGLAGEVDFLQHKSARTVTTFNYYLDRLAVGWNIEAVNITTETKQRSGRTSGSAA